VVAVHACSSAPAVGSDNRPAGTGAEQSVPADGPGRAGPVRVAAPMAQSIAEQLAGWGAAAEVLEPEPVRAELARLGA
jgi:hypothetical protein